MNNLQKLLTKVFRCVCSEIDGNTEHISEDVSTKEIIDLCEEYNFTDLKEKLVKYEEAYEEGDFDKIDEIDESFGKLYPWDED